MNLRLVPKFRENRYRYGGESMFGKQVRNVLWTRKGVRATAATTGHCTQAELTSGHALASCYSCCVQSRGLC